MNLVINAIPLTCKFHRGEETEHHSFPGSGYAVLKTGNGSYGLP
jgi:hypothetical protein